MSPSVYAVLRENLSPTTIETAVCTLSFPLLVGGVSNEAKVVRDSRQLKYYLGREKHVNWHKVVSITQGVSVWSCMLLMLQAWKANTLNDVT